MSTEPADVQAAPHLATAATLYVSVFLVYGCIGLHVWSGSFHNRCFHQALGTMEEYSDTDTICSNDMGAFRHCPSNYNCAPYEKNPFYNTASFDNLGAAALVTNLLFTSEPPLLFPLLPLLRGLQLLLLLLLSSCRCC